MDDDTFAALYPDEPRLDQVRDWRYALERRLAAVRSGDLRLPPEEVAVLEQQLALMHTEEAIAAFIEGPVAQALAEQEAAAASAELSGELEE
jgi:hypothetical protein